MGHELDLVTALASFGKTLRATSTWSRVRAGLPP